MTDAFSRSAFQPTYPGFLCHKLNTTGASTSSLWMAVLEHLLWPHAGKALPYCYAVHDQSFGVAVAPAPTCPAAIRGL